MHHPDGASAQQEQRIYRKLQESRNKLQGVIPWMNDKDFENLREEFCKAFGTFGSYLTEDVKSFEAVNNLNKFYFKKFNHKIQNYNDKQHN